MTGPKLPELSERVRDVSGGVFASRAPSRQVVPLHVGDTWLAPPEGCAVGDAVGEMAEGAHRYSAVAGRQDLRARVAARAQVASGVSTDQDEVLISAGATGGIALLMQALVSPSTEVIILAPAWPLVAGAVRLAGGRVVWLPLSQDAVAEDLVQLLRGVITQRTVCIYVNSPNNPTGRVYDDDMLDVIVQEARRAGLWVIADEVYQGLSWGPPRRSLRARDPSRVISVSSVSKSYGMAGWRVGWVVGPEQLIRQLTSLQTYQSYCASHPGQVMALKALTPHGDRWRDAARDAYRAIVSRAAARLGQPCPESGTFLFVDCARLPTWRGLPELLDDLAGDGVLVAPGPSFGPFPTHIRLALTAAPPDVVMAGVEIVAVKLGLV